MMKLSVEKNNHIQELLGEFRVKLEDTTKQAVHLVDDEIMDDLSSNSKIIATMDRVHFENSFQFLCATFEKLKAEMSEEDPG